jgi:hypothetical protein
VQAVVSGRGSATFTADAAAGGTAHIAIIFGNNQSGQVGIQTGRRPRGLGGRWTGTP